MQWDWESEKHKDYTLCFDAGKWWTHSAPIYLRIVDQSFKTFYYGQGDNNVKVDTIYLKKKVYFHLIQHSLPKY